MTMHHFAAHVGATVRTARERRQRQSVTLDREGEDTSRQLKEAQGQASELAQTTWEHVRTAVRADEGGIPW